MTDAYAGGFVRDSSGALVVVGKNGAPVSVGSSGLAPTTVKTANYTAAAGDLVPVDTTSGAVTVTLPTAPADKAQVAVKLVVLGGSNAVTIARGGTDVFNKAGGSTSLALSVVNQAAVLQYASGPGVWYVVSTDVPLAGLDTRYPRLSTSSGDTGYAIDAYTGSPLSLQSRVVALGNRSTDYNLVVNGPERVLLTATATGNFAVTFSGMADGAVVDMLITQDATGGRTVTLPAASYPAGSFSLNTTASGTSRVTYERIGAAWLAYRAQATTAGSLDDLWLPNGSIAETHRRKTRTAENLAGILATGRMSLTAGMVLPAGVPVSTLTCYSGTTAGATLTHTWFCLINKARDTILKKTVDDTSAAWAVSTKKALALSSTYTPSVDTPVYVGVVCVGTTMPSLLGANYGVNSTAIPAEEPIMCGNLGAAGLTDPASFTSIGTLTANGQGVYAYAS